MIFQLLAYWSTFVTVKGLSQEPRFNQIVRNVTVVTGQTAVLPCSVDYLGTYKVVWQSPRGKTLTLEDRRITADDRFSVERPYVKEWNLHLRMVKTSDSGKYLCQINTDPVQVREIQLHVTEPSRIIDHLSSGDTVSVREGETVELVCNVTGFPPPTVTWYRTHTGLLEDEEDRGRKRIGMEGEVLVIHNVTRYCDDKYECVAYNGVPPAATKEIRVHVEFPPEVRLPNRKISQLRGKSTILECEITAYPQIMSVWKKDGKEITRSNKYSTEIYTDSGNKITISLRIQTLSEEDFGEYECYALNLLGSDSETMLLQEYQKPEEKTTSLTVVTSPNLDLAHETPLRNGESRHRNSNSPESGDPRTWHENKAGQAHSEKPVFGENDEGYSPYSDLKYSKNNYHSGANSGSVISGIDRNRGSAHTRCHLQAALSVLSLLIVHGVCTR